jgi:hypothetical protein
MMHKYHEIPDGTHGSVNATGRPDILRSSPDIRRLVEWRDESRLLERVGVVACGRQE